ncbi:MAG: AI-2E family transporter [Candidatus Rokuibacteriota bacterium]
MSQNPTSPRGRGALNAALRGLRPLLILSGFLLVVACLRWGKPVLMPLALSILLTFMLAPAVDLGRRLGLGRVGSVILVVSLAIAVLTTVAWGLALQLSSLAHDLPQYTDNIKQKIADLRAMGKGGALEKIQGTAKEVAEEINKDDEPAKPVAEKPVPVVVEGEKTGPLDLPVSLGTLLGVLSSVGLVIILVTFMLLERAELRNRLIRVIGHGRLTTTTKALDDAGERITRYLLMQSVVNWSFGAAIGLGLLLIGLPYAMIWGALAAVLRYVPYVGPWVAALPPIVLSLVAFQGWQWPLAVVGLFVVAELVSNNVMEPWLYGTSVGVSPFALLVAIAFWTWLWGPMGLVLSGPLTVCLVVLGKYVPEMHFIQVLMGDAPALEADVAYYQRLLARDQDEAGEIVEAYVKEHGREGVYDAVLVPALTCLRRDREHERLTEEDEQFGLRATREILEAMAPPATEGAAVEPHFARSAQQTAIIGCSAQDEADELAMLMLRQLLEATHVEIQVLSAEMLAAEAVAEVEVQRAKVVCIAAVPPGGLTQSRYLCKRLRQRFPDLRILVGRWGLAGNLEENQTLLAAAGADAVATSLLESRDQLIQTLHLTPSSPSIPPLESEPALR